MTPKPALYTTEFPIRYDECDPYGHVNHAVYLRYMQEAAFQATAAVGYPMSWYEAQGRAWLVRDTDIEYLAPLHYGDRVRVRTWVLDFRRVRSRRAYELYRLPAAGGVGERAPSGEAQLAARAVTDWVYLERETQRPLTVPPEMVAAFMPAGPPPDAPPRERFPEPPPPPVGVFIQSRRVQWADLDPADHVNNATYLGFLEDCAVQDALSRGWPVKRMLEEGRFAIVARRFRIEYKAPAVLNEELNVSSWVSDLRRISAVRHYAVHRAADGALLTRARARWAWVDPESGRPRRIPEDFIADFAPNIVD
ncbi:MAG: thioesterase family protein [Candidatus Promineifilaceae bacterium]|nr:thioesterase family protein [Candidatus Promineifilaceae bacterium]